jgi:hypothetical protein
MLKLAGRLAQGGGDCGYGNCHGAGSIKGNPYHFKLDAVDGKGVGERDNQVKCDKAPVCVVTIPVTFDTPKITDDCNGKPIIPEIVNSDVVTTNQDGSITHCRTWRATDDCNNTTTASQCITVVCPPVADQSIASAPPVIKQGTASGMSGSSTENLKIKVAPNPYSENFKLSGANSSGGKVGVSVYDMTGRLLEKHEVSSSELSELLLGGNLPTGVYNLIVTQGTEVKTLRVIKR